MRSHLYQDHVNTENCIVYAPSQASSENFNIQLQVIP